MYLIVWWSSKLDWFETSKTSGIYKKATKMHYYQGNEEDTTKLHGCLGMRSFFSENHTCKSCCYRLMIVFFSMQKRKERREFERRILMMQGLYGVNTICEVFIQFQYWRMSACNYTINYQKYKIQIKELKSDNTITTNYYRLLKVY